MCYRLNVSLKKRLLSAYNLEKRAPIQWGVTQERNAIEDYCKTTGVTVEQTGSGEKLIAVVISVVNIKICEKEQFKNRFPYNLNQYLVFC